MKKDEQTIGLPDYGSRMFSQEKNLQNLFGDGSMRSSTSEQQGLIQGRFFLNHSHVSPSVSFPSSSVENTIKVTQGSGSQKTT